MRPRIDQTRLLLQERDKEIEHLKTENSLLREVADLMKRGIHHQQKTVLSNVVSGWRMNSNLRGFKNLEGLFFIHLMAL